MKERQPQLLKEHVHFRPEAYIGSLVQVHERLWVIEGGRPVLKTLAFVPAVLKLYEELLANAVQHGLHHPLAHIQLTVRETGYISVTNEGAISFAPGTVASGSQLMAAFGEGEGVETQRGRGGRLVNMFSRYFSVEVGSQQRGEAVKVQWRECLTVADPPQTTKYGKRDYTKVIANLDLKHLGLSAFSADFIGLLERRAWDVAALHRLQIIFNERHVRFPSLVHYAALFARDGAVHLEELGGWRVAVAPSDNGFQQLSFVNGTHWTRNGGAHVIHIITEIASRALQLHRKRLKDPAEVAQAPHRFTSNYFLFIDVSIHTPSFSSVTKDTLLNAPQSFSLPQQALHFLSSHQALQAYGDMARQRERQKENRQVREKELGVARLEDAGKAGVSSRCTLLVVENEAMRQLLAAGLECVNRDYFGVYTLKCRPPNARLPGNSEHPDLVNIAKSLGLRAPSQSPQQLRYGSVVMVVDQGAQGVCVRGLLANWLETACPWAVRARMVRVFAPPVVRCINSVGHVREFLSEREYRSWASLNSLNEWTPTRFGTLATMSPLHMRLLFSEHAKYTFALTYLSPLDQLALALPYGSDADARRKWLEEYRSDSTLDYNTNSKVISLRQFVDKQLAHVIYSEAARKLPHVIDGLTALQRQALFWLLRAGDGQTVGLERLVGQMQEAGVSEEGETVRKTLISMGQSYVGSSNLPIFEGIGQFGSRAANGCDHAPTKHLRVILPPYARLLFPPEDDELLQYGEEQQPVSYVPILPLLAINGFVNDPAALWNSTLLPRKVGEMLEAVRERLSRGSFRKNLPGWEGFKGVVQQREKGFIVQGAFELRCTRTVLIKETPPGKPLRELKQLLEAKDEVEEVKEEQRGDGSVLVVRFHEGRMPKDLTTFLHLVIHLQETPATLLSSNGKPKRYSTAEMLEEHFETRLRLYSRRKEMLLARLGRNIELLGEKMRFIRDVVSGEFDLADSEEGWRLKFVRKGYKRFQDFPKVPSRSESPARDFEYLERMPMNEFSERRVAQLRAERMDCEEQIAQLKRTTERDLWLRELAQFEQRWRSVQKQKEQLLLESLRRAEQHRQQPSEPSPARNHNELPELSLDSSACADLEASKTQGISEQEPIPPKPTPKKPRGEAKVEKENKPEGKEGKTEEQAEQEDAAKAEFLAERRRFEQQIRQMERKCGQFKERQRREEEAIKREGARAKRQEAAEKKQKGDAERAKREEANQIKMREQREKLAQTVKDKAQVMRESNLRREILGRHAAEMGKKVDEDLRREREERERSEKSNRNHLPSGGNGHRITVPYPCDSSTFQVTHVERKRFSSKDAKIDQAEINRIHEDIRRQDEEKERKAQRNLKPDTISID